LALRIPADRGFGSISSRGALGSVGVEAAARVASGASDGSPGSCVRPIQMRSSQGMRLIWVGLLALLSHIPIGMIGGLISERERIKKRTMRKRKKEYLAASAA
jgi:hypothetical protein